MNEDVDVLMANSDELAKRTRPSCPVPNDSVVEKKAELLRAIGREIAEGLVPETILETLEAVEKLDRAIAGNAASASASMRAAYRAVALECTAKLLVGGGGKPGLKYGNAFDRIWRGRVAELQRLGESRLVTSEVKDCWDELEASFCDRNVCNKLLGMNTRSEAVSRVRVYLEEEGKSMGLSFLECEGEFVNEREWGGLPVKESSFKDSHEVFDEEIIEENRDLIKNVKDSERVVEKPSPNTLLGAEIIMSLSVDITKRKDSVENQSEIEVNQGNRPVKKSPEQLVKTSGVSIRNPSLENQGNAPRPSLMERNRTACIYEWDEPIHDLPKATADHERKIYGPSRKTKAFDTPLKNNGAHKNLGRRISRRWSLHEEDTLRTAVKRYGKQWKLILNTLGNEFDERTEVDLKDKWRNMIKYSQC